MNSIGPMTAALLDTVSIDDIENYLARRRATARRPVYFVCPGEPKPCIGSGVKIAECICPNCGQWCVPYPSEANLAAARKAGGR